MNGPGRSQLPLPVALALAFTLFSGLHASAQAQGTSSAQLNPSITISGFTEGMISTQHPFSLATNDHSLESFPDPSWSATGFLFFCTRFADLARSTLPKKADVFGAWVTPSDTDERQAGNHFEGGITPHFVLGKKSRQPVTVTLPVNMAFGDQEYWIGHQFGYVSGGVDLRIPLSFLPARCGKWTAGTNAEICYYGTTMAEFMNTVPDLGAIKISAVLRTDL